MRYVLLNKDNLIASFQAVGFGSETGGFFFHVSYIVTDVVCKDPDLLPYSEHSFGKRESLSQEDMRLVLGAWLSGRCAANHNHKAAALYKRFNIDGIKEFIGATHAASLNDTFWVRSEEEDTSWKDVSLYRKHFDRSISRYSIGDNIVWREGRRPDFSLAPELLTAGSFRRCFENTGEDILFYKRSSDIGLESYSEVLAYEVASRIAPANAVEYCFGKKWRHKLSCCKLFTDEETGLVPYSCFHIHPRTDQDEMLAFFRKIGSEDLFRRMLVIDALTFNVDRHLNNFGVLVDNDTLKIKGMAPIYDLNLSLFGDAQKAGFEDFYSCVSTHKPCFGTDFVQLGKRMLTEEIRKDVEQMEDFSFSFRGDDRFETWRIEKLEAIVREQAKAIRSDGNLTVRQVYVSWKSEETLENEKKYEMTRYLAFSFMTELEMAMQGTVYSDYNISIVEDPEQRLVDVLIDDPGCTGTFELNFTGRSIRQTGKQFPEELVDMICRVFEKYR